jgi:hypothetical protein
MATSAVAIHEVHPRTVDIQPDGDGRFECPECHAKEWGSRPGLASHRAAVHGVKGTHPSTLRIHKRAKTKTNGAVKPQRIEADSLHRAADGLYHCPACRTIRPSKAPLRKHLLAQHGIRVIYPYETQPKLHSSKSSIPTAEVRPVRGKYPCPECHDSFGELRVLGRHRQAKHGITGTSTASVLAREKRAASQHLQKSSRRSNGHDDHSQPQTPEIVPQAQEELERQILYLGGIETGRLQVIADSQGIPSGLLAAGVAELLRRSAHGRAVGSQIHKVPALRG